MGEETQEENQKVLPKALFLFDCQNLYRSARRAWGYRYACFSPLDLAAKLCELNEWELFHVHVYTGVPRPEDRPLLNKYWNSKLRWIDQQPKGTKHSRPLKYRDTEESVCPECAKPMRLVCGSCGFEPPELGHEKGVDTLLALDLVRLAHEAAFDRAIIFSQDQDFAPAALEVNNIARASKRMMIVYSAFPENGDRDANQDPIQYTRAIRIAREIYDECLDLRTYGTPLDITSVSDRR